MSDLIEFLDKYKVSYTQEGSHARSGWVQILDPCPGCDSTKGHLGIRLDAGRASCYKCGHKHTDTLLKTLTNAPWPEIKALVRAGVFVPKEVENTHQGTYTPPKDLRPLATATRHKKYLTGRGLDPEYCGTVWGLQATGPWSNYPFRVFIPITYRNRPVSWTARAVAGQEPKYQTAMAHEKSMDEKDFLFGQDKAKGNTIIVVEGPLGAITVGEGAVATCGMAYTQKQLLCMLGYQRRIICFDNEPEAQRRAKVLAENLGAFPGESFNVCLDAPDPGEISQRERESLRKFAFGKV